MDDEQDQVFVNFDPNDFIIRLSPFLDQRGNWTGELLVGTVTTGENTTTDDDYYHLMQLCQMLCAALPAMEENESMREMLLQYSDSVVEEEAKEKSKSKVIQVEDNVVQVKFKKGD